MPTSEDFVSCRDETVAGYLADREGLDGAARSIFLEQLRDVFGFRVSAPRRYPMLIAGLAVALAGFGIATEVRSAGGGEAVWAWLGMAATGLVLAFAQARSGSNDPPVNREIEWRAYCLLIRPLLLRARPGLLDRNLDAADCADCSGPESGSPLHAGWSFGLSHRWPMPAGMGWTLGCAMAVAWRVVVGPAAWLWGLPLGGAVVGPLVWAIFRRGVFRRLRRAVHDGV